MKNKFKITTLIMVSLLLISLGINVYAETNEVLNGYHQVTKIGGENDTNTINEKDGVKVSKTISETEIENYFDITLRVNTTSKIEEILKEQDLAIVIVMDISNTMATSYVNTTVNGTTTSITRFLAAQNAASNFIDKFAEYSTNVDVSRKLGFVTFNTNSQQIFKLQECKTSSKAETLKNTMITATNDIINDDGYASSYTRFTNIEAGLKRANDMLAKTEIQNKYIIFLSDGFPTTYVKEGYTGYNPYMSTKYNKDFVVLNSSDTTNYGYKASSPNGIFFNELANKLSKDGTSYSDEAARRASSIAKTIKDSNIKIFSVGIGISDESKIDPNSYVTDVDKEKYKLKGDFEIGSTGEQYKAWLKNTIGSGYYYDTNDTAALESAYKSIFDKVKEMSEQSAQATWVAEDPMGVDGNVENIEFLGLYDDLNSKDSLHESLNSKLENQSDNASFSGNKISWDLKNSAYETTTEGNITHYIYEIKYRIRLENELDNFEVSEKYDTNGKTTLTYVIRENGLLSENKYIDFPIPSVVGYLGNLTFTKKSSFDNADLSGAKFKLSHNPNCECHKQKKYANIKDVDVVSDTLGTVTFSNIPSGHTYKLIEIEAPTNYILPDTVYDITVSYGETSGVPVSNIITNDIKRANLEIKKIVQGTLENQETFKFLLEAWYKDEVLTGEYNYKINDGEIKKINISEDIIELKNNDSIIIYDLPVSTTYKITETTTEGYFVEYKINSQDTKIGEVAICNQENNCNIQEGTNKVEFINTTGYLLPDTGSSGMLILIIIGILLFGTPVIYIGYTFYKKEIRIN